MISKYDKKYFEKYAVLSLIYCYDEKMSIMLNNQDIESPDWQSEELDIGLEVTRH